MRGSGAARKRDADAHAAVWHYIGSDILRAILATGLPHAASTLEYMHDLLEAACDHDDHRTVASPPGVD